MAGAGAGAIRAGRAYAELLIKDTAFFQGLQRAEDRLKAFGQRTSEIGRNLMGVSAAVLTPAAMATKVFTDFDDQMRAAAAKTVGITDDQLSMLTDTAERLGREMSFTASDVASGMVQLAQSGLNADQINKMIEPVMNLAKATGTDIAQAAEIATGTMKSFHLEAEDMTHICDVLTATANGSAQTLVDVGEAIKYAGSTGELSGNSLEEVATMLGVMANANIKGTMGGTALNTIISRLAMPKVQKEYEELGVKVTDAAGNLRNFQDIMIDLQKTIGNMPSGEKLAKIVDLFGIRGMKGGANIISGDWKGVAAAIQNAGGVAAQTAQMMEAGLGGSMRRLKSAVEGVAIQIGKSLAPEIQKLTKYLTENASKIASWVSENKDAIINAAKLAFEVGAAGAALVALGTTISGISFTVGAFADVVAIIGTAFGAIAAAPVEAAIIAVGVAAAGATIKMNAFKKSADEIIDTHRKESEADNLALARLKELSEKTDLNNQEMLEAAQIVSDLNSKYTDLGLTYDSVTGSVEGLTDAQAKMNAQQLQKRLVDEREKLRESQEKLTQYGLKHGAPKQEYTLEELQELDKKGFHVYTTPGYISADTRSKWTSSNVSRAVVNPATGKLQVAPEDNGILGGIGKKTPEEVRNSLEKEIVERNNLIDAVKASKENIKDIQALLGQKDAGYSALEAARNGTLPAAQAQAEESVTQAVEAADEFFETIDETLTDKAREMRDAQNNTSSFNLKKEVNRFGVDLIGKMEQARDMAKSIGQKQAEQTAEQAAPILHGAGVAQMYMPAQEVTQKSTRQAKDSANWIKLLDDTHITATEMQKQNAILTDMRDTMKTQTDLL